MVIAMRSMPALILTAVLMLAAGCSSQAEIKQPVQTATSHPTDQSLPAQTAKPSDNAALSPTPTPNAVKPSPAPTEQESLAQSIRNKSRLVLDAFKAKNMTQLAAYTHPDLGVRFSPYSSIDLNKDLVFKPEKLKTLLTDPTVYRWGIFDGSGEPIQLVFTDYYSQFIYDQDYVTAKDVGYNQIIGKGNMRNNLKEVYPAAQFVEYHFPGFDAKFEGHDWKSLRLIFGQKGTDWLLVGIQHDQWTI